MGYLPRAIHLKEGDTVWLKDTMPMGKVKILGVVYGYSPPYKDMLWVEDTNTKEQSVVLTDWVTDQDPDEYWTDKEREAAETSYHSTDNLDIKEKKLKDKSTLSSEVIEGKLPHQILASKLEMLSSNKDSEIRFAIAERLETSTAVDGYVIDEFIENASVGKSPDDTCWVYDKNRIISFRLNSLGDAENINYFVNSEPVRAAEFFHLITEPQERLAIKVCGENQYLLNIGGTKMILDEDNLGLFCTDWKLNYGQVKSSLTKHGKWSL